MAGVVPLPNAVAPLRCALVAWLFAWVAVNVAIKQFVGMKID